MNDVNKQLLEVVELLKKHQKWINNLPVPTAGATHQMMNVVGAAISNLEAIAAAEQAQQAQPVARDVLMAAMRQAVAECAEICDVYSSYKGARCASEIRHPIMNGKLADIADRYAAQPPAVAVLRDWPKLLEMSRQIIRDGHVHDVGGGDLAVTTCEAFEGLDAFLKKNFPEPLGELTGQERKWLEAEAAIQPPFVPEGYALVPVEPTDGMIDAARKIAIDWADGFPNHADGYRAMLAAPQGEVK